MNLKHTVLAAAMALAVAAPALANTSLDAGPTSDLFINVVDATNNTSFLFDTGVSQASFNGANTYSFNFTGDANYQAFVAGQGGSDVLDYSIASALRTTGTPNVGTILFTSNSIPGTVPGNEVSQAQANTAGFFTVANGVSSTTTNSALLGPATTWGQIQFEQAVAANLGITWTSPGTGLGALVGTALNFYNETSSHLSSASLQATLSTYAGTWNFSNGIATYGGGAPVPLPTPVLLLLSGLGLMGVVARRGKGAVGAVAG
jgi:hypothetical protein